MHASKDEKIRNFLTDLETIDTGMFGILSAVREMIFSTYPQVEEKFMYGGIIFSLHSEMFSGLFSYKGHISLEFSRGYLMNDPGGHLEGKGKYRRHLKFKTAGDVQLKEVEYYVKQAV